MQKLTCKDQLLPNQSAGWLLLDSPSEESECSAPTFSPISSGESQSSSRISGHIGSDTKSEDEMNQMSDEEEDLDDNPVSTEDLQPLSEEPDFVPAPEICLGYRFVGDNVDKNIKPSYQRHEHRGQSLHHFHSYVVKDRTVISSYSDATPDFCIPDPQKFLPSPEDVECLKKEMAILLSR